MLFFFPRDVLDEILDLTESVSGVGGGWGSCLFFLYHIHTSSCILGPLEFDSAVLDACTLESIRRRFVPNISDWFALRIKPDSVVREGLFAAFPQIFGLATLGNFRIEMRICRTRFQKVYL